MPRGRAALSTPKMSGVFPEPIEIMPLPHDVVKLVIECREAAFRARSDAKLPVSPAAFEDAYIATGRNLQTTFGLAERFSLRTEPGDRAWMTPEQRDARFWDWRIREGQKVIKQVSDKLTEPRWKVLATLVVELDGFATSASAPDFGYKAWSSLQPHVQALALLGLIDYSADEDDARRRIITATERGRLAIASRPVLGADQ